MQRVPYRNRDIAIFFICRTAPKNVRLDDYYPFFQPFWGRDLGDLESVEVIAACLHNARTHAIENLRLGMAPPILSSTSEPSRTAP